jgi:tetratricopeptide (TPR) repeat protein
MRMCLFSGRPRIGLIASAGTSIPADLDPNNIDTYLTAAYWLRTSLNKPEEAERFLRRGLRANPDSYEIFLALGRVYLYNRKDPRVAHNIFELALQKWRKQEAAGSQPDAHSYEETLGEMVRADAAVGDLKQQLADLQELIKVAVGKEGIQSDIDEVKAKLAKSRP